LIEHHQKAGSGPYGQAWVKEAAVTGQWVVFEGRGGDDYFDYNTTFPKVLQVLADGGKGKDTLMGWRGDDRLVGGPDQDTLGGSGGHDHLYGGKDPTKPNLEEEPASDGLVGGAGNDRLYGGPGSDKLSGEDGDDYLDGGLALDTLRGGSGYDTLLADWGGENLSNGEQVQIALDTLYAQDDTWSCGPNSASRVLRAYGHAVTYARAKEAMQQVWPGAHSNLFEQVQVGAPPHILAQVMQTWKPDSRSSQAQFKEVLNLLGSGRPVVALLHVGYVDPQTKIIPLLHYVALRGFDQAKQEIYCIDTDGQAGMMKFDAFQQKWNWWGRFKPEVFGALYALGVQPRSIVF
jgi:hypothetical protein